MTQLTELHDADGRTRDPRIRELAAKNTIRHLLNNIQYADGISRCRHSKKHQSFNSTKNGPVDPNERFEPHEHCHQWVFFVH
ncbi:hypothetical protein [Psychromicrobium sp. YIM B11713]|uniref:hypothetical protein n=1 Tax=Psychromicrobium sp. YIM B11713 TaxID=3145233 RepID=UPI00374EEA18